MDMVVSRHFPGSSTLCSLGLPPHVGRGDAAVVRSTRSESFFDLITKLRASLRLDFCRYASRYAHESGARTQALQIGR